MSQNSFDIKHASRNLMPRLAKTAISALAILVSSASPAQPAKSQDIAKAKIVAFMRSLGEGDRESFNRITTDGFRAFENGKIVENRKLFFDGVQAAIRAGMQPEMYQTDERSTIGDKVATINYVNHGRYSTPGGMKDIAWLEVVTLQRIGADWQIDFIDSQVQSGTPQGTARRSDNLTRAKHQ